MIPEQKKRSLSIVLAVDKSGSMAAASGRYAKMDLAKEAAVSVIELLKDKDQVGVVAFDAEAEEIIGLGKVSSKGELENRIAGIQVGGGTNAYPALSMAHKWLKNADTQLKHVVLVSDGKSQQTDELYSLAGDMSKDKITVSTIAIGTDADKGTMRDIADLGLGRYHETDDAGELPRILVKEAFAAARLIVERDFYPVMSGDSEMLKGIEQSLPLLRGYIGTSPKEGVLVPIMSDSGDPILAAWQYGLGRTLAFTSEIKPRWAAEWLKWDEFSKFWSQVIGWSLAIPSGEFHVSANIVGNAGLISVDAVDSEGRYRNFLDFQASVVSPNLSNRRIFLKQVGSGRYEAEFEADQMGVYLARVSEMKAGQVVDSQNTGAVVPYSPEYRDMDSNYGLLEGLAVATGGKFRPSPDEIAAHDDMNTMSLQVFWQPLVMLSVFLFFLDVALRRITISRDQILKVADRISSHEKEAPSAKASRIFPPFVITLRASDMTDNLRPSPRGGHWISTVAVCAPWLVATRYRWF